MRCSRRLWRSGRVAVQLLVPLAHERLGLVSAVEATTSPDAEACSTSRICVEGCYHSCLWRPVSKGCTVDARLFACWRTKSGRRPSLLVALQTCKVRQWLWSVTLAAASSATPLMRDHGRYDLVWTARLFFIDDCAPLSAARVVGFFLLTGMFIVIVAATHTPSRWWPEMRRVQG